MSRKTKKLNQQNNLLDKEIKEENQEIFTDMICYLRGSALSEYDVETVRQDLTEMILSAQNRGETIQSVIGHDYKAFCDDVIASLPPKTAKEKLIDTLDIISFCLSVLLVINILVSNDTIRLIQNLILKKPVDFHISFSVGSVISMLVIIILAYGIVHAIMKKAFSEFNPKKTTFILAGILLILMFIAIAWLGKTTLFSANIFLVILSAAVLFIFHKILSEF